MNEQNKFLLKTNAHICSSQTARLLWFGPMWFCIRSTIQAQVAHNERSECVLVYSHCCFKFISFYGSSLVHCQYFNKEISRCSIIQPKASKMKFIIATVLLFVALASGNWNLFEKLWKKIILFRFELILIEFCAFLLLKYINFYWKFFDFERKKNYPTIENHFIWTPFYVIVHCTPFCLKSNR